jgi:hypothetical protein
MGQVSRMIKLVACAVSTLCIILVLSARIAAAEFSETKTSGDLTVYLEIVPAEIVKGPTPHLDERPMHGPIPGEPHEYHVVAALFDAVTGVRITDATVTAQISGMGLPGSSKRLEPMEIANTKTYGTFSHLPGRDLYTVKLTVERPGGQRPVIFDFKYDHR